MMGPTVKEIWVPTADEWDDAWHTCPYATYFHGREWAEVWAACSEGRVAPAPSGVTLSDQTRIVLPFSREKILRGLATRFVSSPMGTFGGWLAEVTLDASRQTPLLEMIHSRYADLWWRVNPYEGLAASVGTARTTSDRTHALDLRPGFEAVRASWQRTRPSLLRSSNKARRAGVSIRLADTGDDWRSYYRVYEDSLARWGDRASSRYPWHIFDTLARRRSPNVRLWLATLDDAVIAGALCFYSPVHAVYWHGAALSAHFALRPVNLLMEEIIRDAAGRGINWFDFNPSGGHVGVEAFKRSFGAQPLACDIIEFRSARTKIVSAIAHAKRAIVH